MPPDRVLRRRVLALVVSFGATTVPVAAQSGGSRPSEPAAALRPPDGAPIPFIDDFRHDGDVAEWRARPIDRQLRAGPGLPQVLLWVGQVADGIVVAAELRSAAEIDTASALSIALAGADSLRLPPLGWGNQFGFTTLADSTGCGAGDVAGWEPEDCLAWLRTQRAHRRRLRPLFQREWRVPLTRPGAWEEVGATPAFRRLPTVARERVAPLEPRGRLAVRERPIAGTPGGRGIEVLIPWSAAPPFPAPTLEQVALGVGFGNARSEAGRDGSAPGAVSAPTSPGLERRRLGRVLEQHITPCRYGTAGLLISGGEERLPRLASSGAVPYMIPEPSGDLRSLIVLDNEAAGYAYQPEPDMRSPAAFRVAYPVIDVGRDERLCGPVPALARDGERISPPGWTESGEGNPYGAILDPMSLDIRRLPSGDLLVKSGPRVAYSYYGSGQCGACPRVLLEFLHISSESGEVTPALSLVDVVDDDDLEIEVSEDWRRVTVWRAVTDYEATPPTRTWNLERHCRTDPVGPGEPPRYEPCGAETDVPEPPRRLRRFYGGAYGPPPEEPEAPAARDTLDLPASDVYQPQPGR